MHELFWASMPYSLCSKLAFHSQCGFGFIWGMFKGHKAGFWGQSTMDN